MLKADFEALILESERFQRVSEEFRRLQDATALTPTYNTRVAPALPLSERVVGATGKIYRQANFIRREYSIEALFRSGSRKPDDGPLALLRQAMEKYRREPSVSAAIRIEMAINRITITGSSNSETDSGVKEAAHLLSQRMLTRQPGGFTGDNIAATLFVDSDFHGKSIFVNLPDGVFTGQENLKTLGFNDSISSLRVQVSPDEIGGQVILFENKRWVGRYLNVAAGGGQNNNVAFVGKVINDRASSLLIYRQFENQIVASLGSLISSDEIEGLVNSQKGLVARGSPILTWDLFPTGSDGHPNDPFRTFVYLRIPVRVDVPHWLDYDAEIRFWISLSTDEQGLLQGRLDFFGAWVESGVASHQVLDRLMGSDGDGIPQSLGQVQALIDSAVQSANFDAPFTTVFLLPGRNDPQGSTDDDVTVVLVPGAPPPPGPIH